MLTETADPMISVYKNGGTSRVGVGRACAGGVEQGWRAHGGVDRGITERRCGCMGGLVAIEGDMRWQLRESWACPISGELLAKHMGKASGVVYDRSMRFYFLDQVA